MPIAYDFEPELVLVSAGFDAVSECCTGKGRGGEGVLLFDVEIWLPATPSSSTMIQKTHAAVL